MNVRLSVIVPVYNGEETISKCLTCLLEQTYPEDLYEIIVVDNNSNDNTPALVKNFPVKYIQQVDEQGPAPTRNKGAQIAKEEGLAFVDADQFAAPTYLQEIVKGWEDPQYGAFASYNVADPEGSGLAAQYWQIEWGKPPQQGETVEYFSGGNLLIRREVFLETGGFDKRLITHEDIDLSLRIRDLGYKIKNNHQAVSHHKERATLSSLIRREFYFGMGGYHLVQKHPGKKKYYYNLAKVVQVTVLGFASILLSPRKLLSGKFRAQGNLFTLLNIVLHWTNFLGNCYACLFRRKSFD